MGAISTKIGYTQQLTSNASADVVAFTLTEMVRAIADQAEDMGLSPLWDQIRINTESDYGFSIFEGGTTIRMRVYAR